jgi:large subunit ribosomal protein L29
MKAVDLRNQDLKGLQDQLQELVKEQFKLKMRHGSGQLAKTHLLKLNKKNIARLRTIICEVQRRA